SLCLFFYSVIISRYPLLPSLFFFSSSGDHRDLHSFPTRRSSDLMRTLILEGAIPDAALLASVLLLGEAIRSRRRLARAHDLLLRSEEHTSELQSRENLVCRLLLEKKKNNNTVPNHPNHNRYAIRQ